jgi:hypothetical protein
VEALDRTLAGTINLGFCSIGLIAVIRCSCVQTPPNVLHKVNVLRTLLPADKLGVVLNIEDFAVILFSYYDGENVAFRTA